MRIYVSHKYGGDPVNKERAERIITELQMNDMENCYLSPIHAFGHLYDKLSYEDGMTLCLDLLETCDRMIVASDISRGVQKEIEMAQEWHMEVGFIGC